MGSLTTHLFLFSSFVILWYIGRDKKGKCVKYEKIRNNDYRAHTKYDYRIMVI